MSGSPSTTTHVEPLLAAYHAGAVSPEDTARVEQHLRGCAACRERSDQIAIDQIIRAAPAATVGPELRQRLYARIATASTSDASETPRATLRDARRAESHPLTRPHGPRVSRGGWLSGVAAALLVALLVGMFWALPHLRQQPNHASKKVVTKPTTACPASATTATLPANAVLNDMALTSPTEGWAVGAQTDAQGGITQGLIMRYSDCHWTPVALNLPGVSLLYISMDSPTDGWAAGNIYGSTWQPFILLRYSNGAWSIVSGSQHPNNGGSVAALSMLSPDEGWLVSAGPDSFSNSIGSISTDTNRLWHFSQGSWTLVATPTHMVDALAPVGPDDLWIAGSDFVGATKQTTHSFEHYHNGVWTVTPQPDGLWASSLHVVSPSDIWASGMTIHGILVIAHYDGATWQVATDTFPAAVANGNGLGFALGDGEGWAYTFGLAKNPEPMNPAGNSDIASVLLETGGKWQSLNWRYDDISRITAWALAPDNEMWIVGAYWTTGTPTPLPGGGESGHNFEHNVLLHYVNGVWTRYG